jgi:hypothetical protein
MTTDFIQEAVFPKKEQSIKLANKILERYDIDPDGDLCVLARQLLRREERLQRIIRICRDAETTRGNDLYVYIGKIARGESV